MQGIESLGYEVKDQPLVPDGGMQQLKGAADLLAEFGRNGDTYVVHAAEGETVLPLEVLESNPKLKTMIYQQMEELGLQPERYVVGNEMNSLNPVTGQPEFFFKKLFKKIKKVGKKVINIAKKVAPIILPLIAPVLLPAAPLFLTAGIGSLAGNLIAGNDFKTSLKNAVIAGGMAGVGSALSAGSLSGFTASPESMGIPAKLGEFFGQGATPTPAISPDVALNQAVPVGEFGGSAFGVSNAPVTNQVFADAGLGLGVENIGLDASIPSIPIDTAIPNNLVASVDPMGIGVQTGPVTPTTGNAGAILTNRAAATSGPELANFQNIMDQAQFGSIPPAGANVPPPFQSPSGMNAPLMPDAQYASVTPTANVGTMDPSAVPAPSFLDDPIQGIQDLYGRYLSPSRPGLAEDAGVLTKYGPLLAVGGAGILAADALFPAEQEALDKSAFEKTGQDLLEEDIASGRFQYGFNPRTFYGSNPFYQRFTRARQGGEIEGPGTGTSDSIPAMLSDGEFVMTAKAVRGAGGNDREKGAKRMYAMMRQFEKEAAA
jgi:hypothetical protein